jgi:hypothetical protein
MGRVARSIRALLPSRMTTNPQKITFGQMRAQGARRVLVYCRNHHCSHHSVINADRWEDRLRLSDVEPTLTCSACGKKGSEIRPDFPQGRMGSG